MKTEKKAFLMVGIGTAYQEARQLAANGMNAEVSPEFPDYEVRHAFASRSLVEKLAEKDGIRVDDEKQALERLHEEGFTEVIVQPFQIFAVADYQKVSDIVRKYIGENGFGRAEMLPCVSVWIKEEPHPVN